MLYKEQLTLVRLSPKRFAANLLLRKGKGGQVEEKRTDPSSRGLERSIIRDSAVIGSYKTSMMR